MTAAPAQPALACEGPVDLELVRIRDLVYQVAGIFLPDNKLHLLLERCQRRMKEAKAQTLYQYHECLTTHPNRQAELVALLNDITIGETCFFRNQPQLDALQQVVLPKIIAAKAKQAFPRLRIWSAGCSTGEEPYTLKILMLEQAQHCLKGWGVEILATDLNENSLEHAKAGLYSSYSTRNLTPYYREKYFTAVEDRLQLPAAVRSGVSFRRLNLSDDARMIFMKNLDLIFCCNVLVYFDLASKQKVIRHFYNGLLPHGYLFLGRSESLYGVSEDFRLVHLPRATAYVKSERSEARKQEP